MQLDDVEDSIRSYIRERIKDASIEDLEQRLLDAVQRQSRQISDEINAD